MWPPGLPTGCNSGTTRRLHAALGYLAPEASEQQWRAKSGPESWSGVGDSYQHVDQDEALAPVDLLPTVVAAEARYGTGRDTLAVDAPGGRVRVTTNPPAQCGSHRRMNAVPGAVLPPDPEVMIDALPFGIRAASATGSRSGGESVALITWCMSREAGRPPGFAVEMCSLIYSH